MICLTAGFIVTAQGWEVLGRVVADKKKLNLVGVAFGNGDLDEGENPAELTTLKAVENEGGVFVDGTTTTPIIETDDAGSVVSFICEYRSDFQGEKVAPISGKWPIEITDRFEIHEFGVWAENPNDVNGDPVMIYYATLGDTPHPVTPYSLGAIDIREYPVSISISEATNITLNYPPLAFVTDKWMHECMDYHHENHCMPDVRNAIGEHNVAEDAHLNLRGYVKSNDMRITALEALLNQDNATPINIKFENLAKEYVTIYAGNYNSKDCQVTF